MTTTADRTALANTYGRSVHGTTAFEIITAGAADGRQADLTEIARWKAIIDELCGESPATPVTAEPDADEPLALMRLIARGLDGPSELNGWSADYRREMRQCADLIAAAGYVLRIDALDLDRPLSPDRQNTLPAPDVDLGE